MALTEKKQAAVLASMHRFAHVITLGGWVSLLMGERIVGPALAKDLIHAFLGATFSGEERHARRLRKVRAIEARYGRTGMA